jgi:hypothetical protein
VIGPVKLASVVTVEANVAVAALPPIFRFATGVVDVTVNGAVPVATVEIKTGAEIFPVVVRLVPVAAPIFGVINVGDVSMTNFVPVPVCDATEVAFPTLVIGPVKLASVVTVEANVAVVALPVNAPINEVDVTDVNPARVIDEPPRIIFVVPIVILLSISAVFGIFVKPAPDPANPVAVRIPVLGIKLNFADDTYNGKLPELDVTHVGKTEIADATSLVIPELTASVAIEAVPFRFAVIVPAAKLPEASLFTIELAVFRFVAALASNSAECIFIAVDPPTDATVTAPILLIAASPLIATAEARFELFPTMMSPLVNAEPMGDTPVIVVFVTDVILPLASTANTGTAVALP